MNLLPSELRLPKLWPCKNSKISLQVSKVLHLFNQQTGYLENITDVEVFSKYQPLGLLENNGSVLCIVRSRARSHLSGFCFEQSRCCQRGWWVSVFGKHWHSCGRTQWSVTLAPTLCQARWSQNSTPGWVLFPYLRQVLRLLPSFLALKWGNSRWYGVIVGGNVEIIENAFRAQSLLNRHFSWPE